MDCSEVWTKTPTATLDYAWDWRQWLGSDTISTAEVTIDPALELTVAGTPHIGDGIVTVWLTGGLLGGRYEVSVEVTTDGGRTDKRTKVVLVRNR